MWTRVFSAWLVHSSPDTSALVGFVMAVADGDTIQSVRFGRGRLRDQLILVADDTGDPVGASNTARRKAVFTDSDAGDLLLVSISPVLVCPRIVLICVATVLDRFAGCGNETIG